MSFSKRGTRFGSAAGISVLELLVVVSIITIVSTLALTSFQESTRSFNLSGATRNLSSYLEKARLDSIRRHGGGSIDLNSSSSYTANIDFSGAGTATAQTINLPAGTTLRYTLPPATTRIDPSTTPITIAYDWRGNTTSTILLTLTDSNEGVPASTVVIGSSGDLSTDTTLTGPVTTPTPQNTTVTPTSGIKDMH